jgi:hypothetical protein
MGAPSLGRSLPGATPWAFLTPAQLGAGAGGVPAASTCPALRSLRS